MCLCFVQPQSSKYKHYVVRRMVNLVTMHPQIMKHWKLKGISLLLACLLQRNRKNKLILRSKDSPKVQGITEYEHLFVLNTEHSLFGKDIICPKRSPALMVSVRTKLSQLSFG